MRNFLCAVSLSLLAVALFGAQANTAELSDGPWRVLQLHLADGEVANPDDADRYTLISNHDGGAVMRTDCNRGRGAW